MPFDSEKARQAGQKSTRKGVQNKFNMEMKDALKTLAEKLLDEKIEFDIYSLPPTERVKAFIALLEFVEPKKSRVDANVNQNVRTITVSAPKPISEVGYDSEDHTDVGFGSGE